MHAEVYLEFPPSLEGIVRLLSVISYDSKGNKIKDYQELIDNADFHCDNNDYRSEVKANVSLRTGISQDNIEIMN